MDDFSALQLVHRSGSTSTRGKPPEVFSPS
eukprot:SAG22_NODE_21068_length_260_cov_0.645963_2_plen_29_part_01